MIKLFFISVLVLASPDSKLLNSMRTLYPETAVKKEKFTEAKTLLDNSKDQTNIINGYRGTLKMIEANYVSNPVTKLNAFNKGKEMLEKAIKTDPGNIELRYLRFTIQANAPSILGYSGEIKSDKEFLMKNYSKITDKTLKKNVLSFLKSSDQLTESEKQKLNE